MNGLPHLQQGVGDGTAVFIQASHHDDAFANWLPVDDGVARQIIIERFEVRFANIRPVSSDIFWGTTTNGFCGDRFTVEA